jgi:hypothetical protein
VDASLIHYFFATKQGLFTAVTGDAFRLAATLPEAAAPGSGTVGERLLRSSLRAWDDPLAREPMLAVVRSAMTCRGAAAQVSDFITAQVISNVVKAHTTSQHELRTTLMGSQVFGVVMARYVLRIEPLAGLPAERVAAILGPALDSCLAEDLPVPARVTP